jgi:hypothetical protein
LELALVVTLLLVGIIGLLVALRPWTECLGCGRRGGVRRKDRKWVENRGDKTVYSDLYECRYRGYTSHVMTEDAND